MPGTCLDCGTVGAELVWDGRCHWCAELSLLRRRPQESVLTRLLKAEIDWASVLAFAVPLLFLMWMGVMLIVVGVLGRIHI